MSVSTSTTSNANGLARCKIGPLQDLERKSLGSLAAAAWRLSDGRLVTRRRDSAEFFEFATESMAERTFRA